MTSWLGWGTNLCCSSILSRSRRYAERQSQPHMVADERQVVGLLPTCAPGFRSVVGTVPDTRAWPAASAVPTAGRDTRRVRAKPGPTDHYHSTPLPVRTFAQTQPLEWWGETVIKANRTKLNYLSWLLPTGYIMFYLNELQRSNVSAYKYIN